MDVREALRRRHSVRGFRREPVPAPVLRRIFDDAQRAPSWCNIQPWRVWVASGARRDRLVEALREAARSGMPQPEIGFPTEYPEPYAARRRRAGQALYEAMGIARDDRDARAAAWMRNFDAFDAPHVAIAGVDRRFGPYALLDLGVWLGTVVLLAQQEGVASCAQASLAAYPGAIRRVLPIPDEIAITVGLSLGYEDAEVPANRCRTDREPLESCVVLLDD
ncbi:MAG: nitroreductase [Myxococcota bacterium]|nr:nitroreductase [Myxococcota bacterium]